MHQSKVDAVVFLDAAARRRRSFRPHPTDYAESLIDSCVPRNIMFRQLFQITFWRFVYIYAGLQRRLHIYLKVRKSYVLIVEVESIEERWFKESQS